MKTRKNAQSEYELLTKNYYNIAQCRIHIWNTLKLKAAHLSNRFSKNADITELREEIKALIDVLMIIETYWAYPGKRNLRHLLDKYKRKEYTALSHAISELVRDLSNESYRNEPLENKTKDLSKSPFREDNSRQYYYEVLFVDNLSNESEEELRNKLSEIRDKTTRFTNEMVVVKTFQDALIALLFNFNIQSCVIRYDIPFKSVNKIKMLKPFIGSILDINLEDKTEAELGPILGKMIKEFRPELDLYLVTDKSITATDDNELKVFRRVFYRQEDLQELHLSIKRAIASRFETPFFSALVDYSQRPTGVFHAMPISRGNSVFKSHWARDLGDFYGRNLFLAETSATTGGLDSLLQPTGPLKKSQKMAAQAFGAQHTFYVTNGTSTSNKIVAQALVQPGEIVLVDRDCHKSHHYSLVLAGAYPVYLDSYPVPKYCMYGAVPTSEIKKHLLDLKKKNRLHLVKMITLTNCTFDGLVYNVESVMEEVLAIKPDMVFLWDEAWFGFASFTYTYRQRTAMYVAAKMHEKYRSAEYRAAYEAYQEQKKQNPEAPEKAMPDPDKVKIRVYATQSTHKTLTSLRQGSMIHVYDEEFQRKVAEPFHEAYMTHISTSANYQILASLDVGRRQVAFEGYEMVEKSIEMAMALREKVTNHPKLKPYFEIVTIKDYIPEAYRHSGLEQYYDPEEGWGRMEKAWAEDEFVLDTTKVTLYIGKTGVDGDTFKNRYLMDQFGIQINKTSRNTVLFMTNIGTTKSSVSYLIGVLLKIAEQLENEARAMNRDERKLRERQIYSLTEYYPPLPDFSRFHKAFQPHPGTPEGDLRKAFFLAYREELCEHLTLNECENKMYSDRELVSASFVIPYPPGFPILVPGQVVSKEIVNFMKVLDVKEIHGYRHDLGLRIFSEEALQQISLDKKATEAEIELQVNGNEPKKTPPSGKRKKKVVEEIAVEEIAEEEK